MAELKFGNSGEYRIFEFKDMAKLSDSDLNKLAKRVVRIGTTYLAQLASEGLTQAMLTALTALSNSFDDAQDAQEVAIENRNLATQDRVEKGNTLYAEVARLCSIGRTLYAETNPAKYNDYIIYGSEGTKTALRGLVRNSLTQEPIVDANINIPALGLSKFTNSEGRFEVQTMEAGSYDINVSHPEYQPITVTVIIVDGETTNVTVDLVHI
jgi:hypothetical protein